MAVSSADFLMGVCLGLIGPPVNACSRADFFRLGLFILLLLFFLLVRLLRLLRLPQVDLVDDGSGGTFKILNNALLVDSLLPRRVVVDVAGEGAGDTFKIWNNTMDGGEFSEDSLFLMLLAVLGNWVL